MAFLSRRSFLQYAGAGTGLLLSAAACKPGATKPPPNVVFIVLDDLNDYVGFLHGHPQAHTPNMDRLAARGMVFEHAYCQAPLCIPSRDSFLTGLQPSTLGVYFFGRPIREILPAAVTLPQYFKMNGYDTLNAGKIFHTGQNDPEAWLERSEEPREIIQKNPPVSGLDLAPRFDWGPIDASDEDMPDYQVANWAIGQLQKPRTKPFFLGVGFGQPHVPMYAPKKYFDLFPLKDIQLPVVKPDDLDDIPPTGRELAEAARWHAPIQAAGQWPNAVQAYLACVAFADAQVGRVLDALAASPHANDTIVVLFGDNGWHLGEKLHWHKMTLWEESAHVPLIIAMPGNAPMPGRCGHAVGLIDLFPTLANLCGLPEKTGLEGHSLAPLIKNPEAPWNHPVLTNLRGGHFAVRDDRWCYIRYHDGSEELYDHGRDPHEWINRAADPECAPIKAALAKYIPANPAPDAVPNGTLQFPHY